jgi:hypothetical protein
MAVVSLELETRLDTSEGAIGAVGFTWARVG